MAKAPTPTIQKGTKFRSGYADANPEWEVLSKAGRDVWRCKVTDDCADYHGTVKMFSTKEIKHSLSWLEMFATAGSQSKSFYDTAKLGSIVHYYNGFKEYVRCEVVMGVTVHSAGKPVKCLKPIAMIGKWPAHDLPRRLSNGDIQYGHHAKQIRDGEVFAPHASNIYESPDFTHRNEGDPTSMKPLDLSVPEMNMFEAKNAKLERDRQEVIRILQETRDAGEAFKLAAPMIHKSVLEFLT